MTLGVNLKCFNCGEDTYYNVTSGEGCDSCGINCGYWGQGANDAMQTAIQRMHLRENGGDDDPNAW